MIHKFYIELLETDPLVWRRIVVPSDYTLYQFHMAMQGAFGWENRHLFQFCESGFSDKTVYGIPGDDIDPDMKTLDAKKTKMNKIFKEAGDRYRYIYDFGDSWEHRIVLENVEPKEMLVPCCLDGAGNCPPEDVGGVYGYKDMLEIFKKPRHPQRAQYIQWLGLVPGEKWDANFCSIREVNKRLVLLAK